MRKKSICNPSAANKSKLVDAEKCLLDLMSAAKSMYEFKLVEEYTFNKNNRIFFNNITDLDVFTALTNVDPTKSSGIDGIGQRLLCACAPALYPAVHH